MAMPTPPSMSGGAGGAAGPSSALGSSAFDSSGWNVNYGEGDIASGAASGLGQYTQYILLAAGLLIAWRIYKAKR